jgi:hypothetical protein
LATPVIQFSPKSATSNTRHHLLAQNVRSAGLLWANVIGDHWNEWGCCSINAR